LRRQAERVNGSGQPVWWWVAERDAVGRGQPHSRDWTVTITRPWVGGLWYSAIISVRDVFGWHGDDSVYEKPDDIDRETTGYRSHTFRIINAKDTGYFYG